MLCWSEKVQAWSAKAPYCSFWVSGAFELKCCGGAKMTNKLQFAVRPAGLTGVLFSVVRAQTIDYI